MPKSPGEMSRSMLRNLPEKTGRDPSARQDLLAKEGLTEHQGIMAFLEGTDDVSSGYDGAG